MSNDAREFILKQLASGKISERQAARALAKPNAARGKSRLRYAERVAYEGYCAALRASALEPYPLDKWLPGFRARQEAIRRSGKTVLDCATGIVSGA